MAICGAVICDRNPQAPGAVMLGVIVWLSRATVDSPEARRWLDVARRHKLPCRVAIEEELTLPDGLLDGIEDLLGVPTFTQADKEAFIQETALLWRRKAGESTHG